MADYHQRPAAAASSSPFLSSLPPDRELYTVPLCSNWFRWDEIHDTERRALREFFDSPASISRSPRVYKEYRDFIINKYREDPFRRLTFTEIRRCLVGDVGLLQKLFAFLDSWGLINFSAIGGEGEEDRGLPAIRVGEGPPSGIKVVPSPNSTKAMEPPQQIVANSGRKVGGGGAGGIGLSPLSSYSDVFGNSTGLNAAVCGHCGERCTGGHYELNKGGLAVCTKCFNDEKHKDTRTAGDFQFNDVMDGSDTDWTDLETLHLLESVIAKRNDWALISDQARRSKLDCMAKLIQLPFGEHMLSLIGNKHDSKHSVNRRVKESNQQHFDKHENVDAKHPEHHTSGDGKEKNNDECFEPSSKRRCIALTDASSMDRVAALSAVAGPCVANSAAEAAIVALCHEYAYAKKVFNIGTLASDEPGSTISDAWPPREPKVEDQLSWEQSNSSDTPNLEKNFVHLTFQMHAGIATALGSVAARAKLLADQEDREIELLMSTILEMQIKKLQIKIRHFEELELIMEKEYIQMQQLKNSMLAEWVRILQIANEAGILKWRDQGFSKSLQSNPG